MGDAAEQNGGLFGSAWGMASSAWNYASQTVNSLLGYEDLDVVDPTAGEAAKAGAAGAAAAPAAGPSAEARAKHFTSWREYLGKDITSLVILPVWIMQPFTMLQNMAEIMEYTAALDRAAATADPYERMAWVVGFTMGPFGAVDRPWKPFNPILGETFEYRGRGVRFVAEQVSHHPPVGVSRARADSGAWEYGLVSAPRTKFLGNSVEVYPVGRTRIRLAATGEALSLVPPTTKACNVVVGATWIDTYGDYTLSNATTGAAAHLAFSPCGWFGAGRYQVAGHVRRPDGTPAVKLTGAWNSHLDAVACGPDGEPQPGAQPYRVWQCAPKPEGDPYGFTAFAHELNAWADGAPAPLPSDSRRRPDRAALEAGRSHDAAVAKHNLEEMQRAERRRREAGGGAGADAGWAPRWFRRLPPGAPGAEVLPGEHALDECPAYEFTGEYDALPPAPGAAAAEVRGVGFSPWQHPELHPKLGRETER